MSRKIVTTLKNVGVSIALLFGIISCEQDLEDIAIGLVDNPYFSVGDTIFEVIAYNINIDSSRVDNNNLSRIPPLSLLGVNRDENFGHKKSAVLSQLNLPLLGVDFGLNATIDTVILDIPYFATKSEEDQDAVDPETGDPILDEGGNPIQVPDFTLDSVYGNTSQKFQIIVNELGTYLNELDPDDPTKKKAYYSDKEYQLEDELFSGDFITNRNDTVLYVLRKDLDGDPNTIDQIDTIKALGGVPSMKFNLNEEFFQNNFIDNPNSGDFDSNANFIRFFKGLYVDADGQDGALTNIAGLNATMTIYYSNDVENDGETVRIAQTMRFPFAGVRTAKYENSYAGFPIEDDLLNPDKENGEAKLYVQGAAGTEVIIELFSPETLEMLRNEDLLINEANLKIYIDNAQNDEVPNRLFLYNYDDDSTLKDFRIDGLGRVYGGELQYDDDGNPESYKFRITYYISDVLDLTNPIKLSKLALKNFVTADIPTIGVLDTVVRDYNWIPKGVVLKGNLPELDEKRIKLELFYSKSK